MFSLRGTAPSVEERVRLADQSAAQRRIKTLITRRYSTSTTVHRAIRRRFTGWSTELQSAHVRASEEAAKPQLGQVTDVEADIMLPMHTDGELGR